MQHGQLDMEREPRFAGEIRSRLDPDVSLKAFALDLPRELAAETGRRQHRPH
jgi:hypothetical protein